jgi:hypothetical protein
MRVRFFTAAMAVTLAVAVVAAFGTAAGARSSVAPKAAHIGKVRASVHPYSTQTKLWNQNKAISDSGVGIVSQDFGTDEGLDAYDSQGADDFKVPALTTWKVKEVDVTGVYFNGPGPATSVNVTFYKNASGLPGVVKKSYPAIAYSDPSGLGSYIITLPTVTKLTTGTYWVSVQAVMDFSVGGEWGWETRTTSKSNPAAWQNPGGGFGIGCTTWGNMQTCIGPQGEGPDFMFALYGSAV